MSGDPFLDALDAKAGAAARLTSEQLAQIASGIPGVHITSGQRDPAHNAAVGGVPNSQHIAGTALDFVAPGMSLDDVRAKFPGEQVIYHDAGSGMHFHVQGARGEQQAASAAPPPAAAPAPQPAAPDPYLAALDGASKGADAGHPQSDGPAVGGAAGGVPLGVPDGSGGQGQPAPNGSGQSFGQSLAAITPLTDSIVNGRNYFSSLRDDAAGFATGALKVPATALNVGAYLADHIPAGERVARDLRSGADDLSSFGGRIASDPNSGAYGWGTLGGEIGATLPASELTPLTAAARLAKAGKVGKFLARYGDMAIQGGVAGAGLSGGKDMGEMGKAAMYGAALAPAIGGAGDLALPSVIRAGGAVADKAKSAADWLSQKFGSVEDVAPTVAKTIRKMSDMPPGWTPEEFAQGWRKGADGKVENITPDDGLVWSSKTLPDGRLEVGATKASDIAPSVPKSATPEEVSAALGSRGSNSGLEANTQLPPQVALHVDRLRMQGVPLDQAVREAEVAHVGAQPTIANVTRNPEDQAAVWEGAKQATPEGRALAAQIAQNNAAAVGKVQGMVQDYGGVPAQGEAAETAATSLAKASDAEKAKVTEAYQAADDEAARLKRSTDANNRNETAYYQGQVEHAISQADAAREAEAARVKRVLQGGGSATPRDIAPELPEKPQTVTNPGYINLAPLNSALDAPELVNPTIEGGRTLRSGIKGLIKAYGGADGKVTLQQAEGIRQALNDAYDPMGGGINGHIGRLKNALDQSLDATEAGPAYKAARAAHKAWAEKYDNPEGISGLIRRDAQGNFVNGDNWRRADNFIASTADRPFIQVVKQIKANGDTAALQRLKASVLQRAYERATNNATDKLGNATLNGKLFFAELNKIGTAKLNALFSPAELAEISTTGRAAIHMNEAVPGTNNTPNTASALARALASGGSSGSKLKTGARVAAHGVGILTGHLGGNVAVEGAHKGADYLSKQARAKLLAQGLRESMDPTAARASAKAQAKRMADALQRRRTANNISERSAPMAGVATKERKH